MAGSEKDGQRVIYFDCDSSHVRLIKWKVKPGNRISQGSVLLLYSADSKLAADGNTFCIPKKWKATVEGTGTVMKLHVEEGESLEKGCVLMTLKGCLHPVIMKDMCADCGADLRESKEERKESFASVSMVHSVPELRVSKEQAQILGQADERRLLEGRKLVLLVDLDQTLIHTTNDDVPNNLKDVHHFQLYGPHSPWYHARLRPGTKEFLDKMDRLYELHICTFGARLYAHTIADILDCDGRYFAQRILSRDECFSANSKTANLKALFPCGDNMVVIIDDREDVWNFAPNVVHVKPYHFFQHTGDINAPPGMTKTEDDEEASTGRYLLGKRIKKVVKMGKSDAKIGDLKGDDGSSNREENQSQSNIATLNGSADLESVKGKETDENLGITPSSRSDQSMELDGDPSAASDVGGNLPTEGAMETDDNATKNCVTDVSEATVKCAVTLVSNEPVEGVNKVNPTESDKAPSDIPPKQEVAKPNVVIVPSETDIVTTEDADKEEIEVEDEDDYLLYLGDILTNIHQKFYESYDTSLLSGESPTVMPDMKTVIPKVRRHIMHGLRLVFSGVIPTNMPMETSRAFYLARSMGADVQSHLMADGNRVTTHVVAARLGTVKVNEARRIRGVHIVTPAWLWSCAERWERVDEKMFPLTRESSDRESQDLRRSSLHPSCWGSAVPDFCKVATPSAPVDAFPTYDPVTGKRTNACRRPAEPSEAVASTSTAPDGPGRPPTNFSETINPLMAFSSEDFEKMDREVDDLLEDSEGDSEPETGSGGKKRGGNDDDHNSSDGDHTNSQDCDALDSQSPKRRRMSCTTDSSSSSMESLSGTRHPRGWSKNSGTKRCREAGVEESLQLPMYPRAELPLDSDRSVDSNSGTDDGESVGSVDEEMAAAVEREFLGL